MTPTIVLYSLCLVWSTEAGVIRINGIGGTFPADVFQYLGRAFERHRKEKTAVKFHYEVNDNLAGKTAIFFKTPHIIFGSTLTPMTPAEVAANPNVKVFPIIAGLVLTEV